MATDESIVQSAQRIAAAGESARRAARDPVNRPMVHNWVEAIGDANPVYTDEAFAAASVHSGLVAPPAMAQVWTMGGLHPDRDPDDPLYATMRLLDEAGFTSVVATNCEQEYHRYLRPGEHLTVSTTLEGVAGPKRTALGEGWFVTTRNVWRVGEEPVATMLFRVLKFRPPNANNADAAARSAQSAAETEAKPEPRTDVIRPAISRDTEFFWAGTAARELRIQRCGECGVLRHPPGPMCPECGATKREYVVSPGRGEVFSYVVHHNPPVPGKTLPFVIALVELAEGVRLLGELVEADAANVHIGQQVRVDFARVDDELTLPVWRVIQES